MLCQIQKKVLKTPISTLQGGTVNQENVAYFKIRLQEHAAFCISIWQ